MFGKKSKAATIDKEQLELIQHAQKRIKQKKRFYTHFILFAIGVVFFILAGTVLGIGKEANFLGVNWTVYATIFWTFLIVYHFLKVYLFHSFMGKQWEQKQLEKLVNKQKKRIEELSKQILAEDVSKPKTLNPNTSPEKKANLNELTLIVAAGEDNAIGKDNQLIWHLSDDLKRFKQLTSGHCIIMGRKTFESFPKPLPNRTHIVITRQTNYKVPTNVIVVNSLEDALDAAKHDQQPFVIGGGQIYAQALSLAKKIELTRVHANFPQADTYFPKINLTNWIELTNVAHPKDENHEHPFSFITLVRKAS